MMAHRDVALKEAAWGVGSRLDTNGLLLLKVLEGGEVAPRVSTAELESVGETLAPGRNLEGDLMATPAWRPEVTERDLHPLIQEAVEVLPEKHLADGLVGIHPETLLQLGPLGAAAPRVLPVHPELPGVIQAPPQEAEDLLRRV